MSTPFGIPDADAELAALGISDQTRLEAWETAVEQADAAALPALAGRLHKRMELLRRRELSPHVERAALAMIAERQSAPGPAVIGPHDATMKE